ncbi:MAG TPA: radical SAM protein [Phycisphaerae bacterium]|nr:radical SAM protein [Phycisphaerae bacterium]
MKTLLVNPPWFCLMNRQKRDLHLGLAYVAGALTAAGSDVQILNGEQALASHTIDRGAKPPPLLFHATEKYLAYQDPSSPIWRLWAGSILAESPDVVGLTSWSAAFFSTVNTCKALKAIRPDVVTVVGGVHATLDPSAFMDVPEVDFVVRGEGERAAVALWGLLRDGGDVRRKSTAVRGVWTRLDGRTHDGGTAALIEPLDDLPFPSYDRLIGRPADAIPGLVTSRGCPFRCGFCASDALWTARVRFRSVDSCLDELEDYRRRYGLESFRINDDSFCVRKGRVLEFCDKLVKRFGRGRVSFWADANADTVDDDMIEALESAGCSTLCLGIESVAPRIRRQFIRKKVDLDHMRRLVARINRSRVSAGAYFMTGFPHETEQELIQTVEFMKDLKAEINEWSVVTPYPGTELHRYALEHGILPDAGPEHLMHHSLKTSMADIPLRRHEEILREVLDICEALRIRQAKRRGGEAFYRRWRRRLLHPGKTVARLFRR